MVDLIDVLFNVVGLFLCSSSSSSNSICSCEVLCIFVNSATELHFCH